MIVVLLLAWLAAYLALSGDTHGAIGVGLLSAAALYAWFRNPYRL